MDLLIIAVVVACIAALIIYSIIKNKQDKQKMKNNLAVDNKAVGNGGGKQPKLKYN